jgi:N5-(cytidine 5'-diphosphoramidyl)-L-glutamine hydrolase
VKRVVVSMRIDEYPDREERRDAVDQDLIRFIFNAGFFPVLVPNSMVEVSVEGWAESPYMKVFDLGAVRNLERFIREVDPVGVVLSGGNDIGSCEDRDITEQVLLRYALKHQLPALGLCRGMQMMGVFSGVELTGVSGHVRTRHQLVGEIKRDVNSYHNLGLSGCPDGFRVLATAEDGGIEAIRSGTLNWEGWMWHPERENPFNVADIKQFQKLFS